MILNISSTTPFFPKDTAFTAGKVKQTKKIIRKAKEKSIHKLKSKLVNSQVPDAYALRQTMTSRHYSSYNHCKNQVLIKLAKEKKKLTYYFTDKINTLALVHASASPVTDVYHKKDLYFCKAHGLIETAWCLNFWVYQVL